MVKSLVSKLSSASSSLSLSTNKSNTGAGAHGTQQAVGGGSTSIPETKYAKHRNDPGRFFGDGVQFKAKLIGILEVGEARGDRMCQEALQDLKMAIRAAGEHKQRITIHVTIDGLRLRDEKTGDSLYHHPVHKISFIAQDMTDSRAFGYIFGSPDSGHRFFGIKTDKAASQVVLAMRDLFQVVFELKKKEIELARQQIQSKSIHEHQLSSLSSLKNASGGMQHNDLSGAVGSSSMLSGSSAVGGGNRLGVNMENRSSSKELSPESVADLVDLEQELSSLQRGITQMERITPSEAALANAAGGAGNSLRVGNEEDPFGDSFTNFPAYNLLPPPESGRNRNKPGKGNESSSLTMASLLSTGGQTGSGSPSTLQQLEDNDDDSWLRELDQHSDVFDTTKSQNTLVGAMAMGAMGGLPMAPLAPSESTSTPTQQLSENSGHAEVPNGGATDILTGSVTEVNAGAALLSDAAAVSSSDVIMMPHDTDPFSPTRKKSDPDPFQEGDLFSKLESFEFVAPRNEGDAGTAAAGVASSGAGSHTSPTPPPQHQPPPPPTSSQTLASAGDSAYNSPLQVQLPPEPLSQAPLHWKADISRLERPASDLSMSVGTGGSTVRSRPSTASYSVTSAASSYAQAAALKQQTVDVISSISNKKMPHLFGQARFSKRDSNTINMRRLQESDSLSENETAPEPPPRPDSTPYSEPPPLPPKKQFNDIVIRPRSSSSSAQSAGNRYESLSSSSKMSSAVGRPIAGDVPPIPLPSRRVGRSDGTYPGPSRPRKPGHTEDDYLAPISDCTSGSAASLGPDVPPLLPPPTQISTRVRTQRQQSLSKQPPHDIYENKEEILQQQLLMKKEQYGAEHMSAAPIAPDITLTQLLTLGIDDLAARLNVPTSKLSTMTLVELTSYLSDYLTAEHSKPKHEPEGSIFRVSFDQQSTFVAKFDDTFGEDPEIPNGNETFVANFEQFNEPPVPQPTASSIPAVPPADRYAVFREIIDQELQHQQENTDLMGDLTPPPSDEPAYLEMADAQTGEPLAEADLEGEFDNSDFMGQQQHQAPTPTLVMPKIDTKITEVVAQAKDRYAALRDIILVENLFDKKPSPIATGIIDSNVVQDFTEFSDEFNDDQDLRQIMDDRASGLGAGDRLGIVDSRGLGADASSSVLTVEDDDEEDEDADGGGESSGDSNEKDIGATGGGLLQDQYEKLSTSNQQLDNEKLQAMEAGSDMTECVQSSHKPSIKQDNKFLTVSGSSGFTGSKDDLEIDELMQRAISNLSLDSRERISPASSTMNQRQTHSAAAGIAPISAAAAPVSLQTPSQYNDMSTSPIPLQKSPIPSTTSSVAGLSLGNRSTMGGKSPQVSPIPSQLSAVSQLIDTVSRQVGGSSKDAKDSWATFETSSGGGGGSGVPLLEHAASEKRASGRKQSGKQAGKMSAATSLHLPPPPPSNTSQNDTAESPVSSDPREDGWRKGNKPGSAGAGGGGGSRRWTKKERQQTSSSSRDISPWDDEAPDYQKHKRMPPVAPHHERHGYYMRHAKRMNSCDEDFDYDEELNSRRDQRKFKHGLSRSRDNFDLDSPSWYHHQAPYTWTAQDIEQARGRSFERSAYERSTYGPPIYDKRGVPLQPMSGAASYDRRAAGGGYDKRKYYRDYTRPNYDFDEYGESPPPMPERSVYRGDSGSFEKLKLGGRRADYENVYDEGGRGAYKARAEYMYERDRKSFDRESVESFESATRRRRSFGSGGDMYGSLESREDFRERYLGGGGAGGGGGPSGSEKTRSLRRATKLRVAGEIDYEQDSEGDFQHQQQQLPPSSQQQRGRALESRSLQRPSQLNTGPMVPPSMSQTRVRKSSGSSPWDGEEPPPLGQKPWKRPSSAADSERRRAAALTQTPSGSDGEKDRRFRKKQRARAKDTHSGGAMRGGSATGTTGGRYGNITLPPGPRDNYDYIACDDDIDDDDDYVDDEYGEPPTDEDKFERLNRRRHEMHQRMHESERRQYGGGGGGGSSHKVVPPPFKSSGGGLSGMPPKKYQMNPRNDYDFDAEYDHKQPAHGASHAPQSHIPSGSGTDLNSKFSFDGGFESDFNQSSPPPAPAGTGSSCNSTPAANMGGANSTVGVASKASFRFSNDFSDRERAGGNVGGGAATAMPTTLMQGVMGKTGMQEPHHHHHQPQQFDHETRISPASQMHAHGAALMHNTPPIQQKLRFDDNVKVSQFDDGAAFEDDFAKSSFDFEKADQWNAPIDALSKAATNGSTAAAAAANAARKHSIRNSKLQQRQELIKKSESINIFAKKSEDPFEDDEFFSAPTGNDDDGAAGEEASGSAGGNFQWEDETNFAKFDKNM